MTRGPRTLALMLGVGVLLCGQNARRQQPAAGTPTPPPDMTKAPVPGEVQPYTPPSSHEDQLPNGLHIIVIEDHRFPLVSVRISLRAGDSRVAVEDAGLDDAEADLLAAGTPTRTALQVAETADRLGGSVDASAGPDFLTINGNALSPHAGELFQLLADITLNPTFPETEVSLRKANMLQELAANRADPDYLAGVQFDKLLYGEHPYATTAPTEASIARISRAALVAFHQKYFLPNNQGVVVVAGDVNAARAHNLVQQYFGDWKFGQPTPPLSPAAPERTSRRIYLIDRPGSAQSTVMLGNIGLTRTAPDYFPFVVANEVLGGSFNSRLIADLREAKGYTYGISSSNEPNRDLGAWVVSTEVRTAVTAPALAEIFADLEKLRSQGVSEQELAQAKNYLGGNFVLGLQTQEAVAAQFLTTQVYGLPDDRLATWVNKVMAVSADQVQAAAQKTIQPDKELVVVVGDVKQIEGPLAALAPATALTIYDDKGNVTGTYPSPAAAATAH